MTEALLLLIGFTGTPGGRRPLRNELSEDLGNRV